MRSFVLITLLAGVAVASASYSTWPIGQELQFMFENELVTGIPGIQSQYAGLKLASKVIVQTFQQGELRVKMVDSKFVNINDKLPYGADGRPVLPRAHQAVPERVRRWLETPFSVRMNGGLVDQLAVERDEPVEVTNIKKALLSQLQLDLSNEIVDSASVFTRQETSLVGDCETAYDMHKLTSQQTEEFEQGLKGFSAADEGLRGQVCEGKEYFEIVKTKNMDKCQKRPVMLLQVGLQNECDANKDHCKDVMTHVSSSRFVICGRPSESFFIRHAETLNMVNVVPLAWNTEEKMISNAKLSLQLIKVLAPGSFSPLPKPQNVLELSSLLFGYENKEGVNTRETLLAQPDLTHSPIPFTRPELKHRFVQEIESKMRMVAEEIFNSPESCSSRMDVAGHLSAIAKSMRILDISDLQSIEQNVLGTHVEKEKMGKLWTDVLVMVGTNPSIMLIKRHVEEGRLDKWTALSAVQSVIRNGRFPTEAVLKEIFTMVTHLEQSREVEQFRNLGVYNAGLQQLTALVYDACVNPSSNRFPVHVYGRFCHKDADVIVNQIIPYLVNKIQHTTESSERLVYITALGKLGHSSVLAPLLSVIEGRSGSLDTPIARSVAVYALKRVARLEPTLIRPVLMSLIENVGEVPEVRMAAISLLPFTQPPTSDLQRLAIRTWFEPCKQVTSYIYSTLNSLSVTDVPELKFVGQKAQSVVYLVKPEQSGIQFSHNVHVSKFVHYLKMASVQQANMVRGPDAYFPSKIGYSYDFFGGNWHVEGLSFNIYTRGMDNIMDNVFQFLFQRDTEVTQQVRDQLEKIRQTLRIERRANDDQANPEVLLMIKSLGLENAFAIDSDIVSQLLGLVSQKAAGLSRDLFSREGKQVSMSSAFDMLSMEIYGPTDSGFPLYLERTVPMCYAIKGSVSLKSLTSTSPSASEALTKGKFEVVSELRPVWNSKMEANLGLISPFTQEFIGSGVEVSFHASLPLHQRLQINARDGQVAIGLSVPKSLRSHDDVEIFHFFVEPYTLIKNMFKISPFTKDADLKTILTTHQPRTQWIVEGGSFMGLRAQYNLTSDSRHMDTSLTLEKLSQLDLQSALATLPIVSSVKQFSSQLIFDPSQSLTKEMRTLITFGYGQRKTREALSDWMIEQRPIYGQHEFESSSMYYPNGAKDWSVAREVSLICDVYHGSEQEKKQCLEQSLRRIQSIIHEAESVCKPNNKLAEWQNKYCRDTFAICTEAETICKNNLGHYHLDTDLCREQKDDCVSRRSTLENIHQRALKHNDAIELIGGVGIQMDTLNDERLGAVWSIFNRDIPKVSKRRVMDLHLSAGGKVESGKLKSRLHMVMKKEGDRMTDDQFEIEVNTDLKVPTIRNRWNIERILQERPTANLVSEIIFGKQESRQTLGFTAELSKSERQMESVKQSSEYRRCRQQQNKLASVCEQVRHQAAALDQINLRVQMPESFKQCPIPVRLEAALRYLWLVNGDLMETTRSSLRPNELIISFDRTGKTANINFGSKVIKGVHMPYFLPNVFPLSVRNPVWELLLIQKPTKGVWPASCRLSNGIVSTFDNLTYSLDQSISKCGEKLLFKDCSMKRPIAVVLKHQQGEQVLQIVAGKHIVNLRPYQQRVAIEIDGRRSSSEQSVVGDLELVRYDDGVVVVRHSEVEVFFDGQDIEIVAPFMGVYNKACGLCGDLNLESTADLETPERCVISDPRLAAFSYLMKQDECRIPQLDRQRLSEERGRCSRKQAIITSGLSQHLIDRARRPLTQIHKVVVKRNELCISKRPLNVCVNDNLVNTNAIGSSNIKKIAKVDVAYTCFPYPSLLAEQMAERAENADIMDELTNLPTTFTKEQQEPVVCRKTSDYNIYPNIQQHFGY